MRLLCCLMMTMAWCAGLLGASVANAEDTHIRAVFEAESATPASGRPLTIALVMRPAPGWHGYWKNPGDAGVETRVRWTLPSGVTAGSMVYPVPGRLSIAGLMNYIYEGPYAHLITIKIPAGLKPGTSLPIRADVDWLACTDRICVPERDSLALDLVVGDGRVADGDRARFDRYRAVLPKPLNSAARFAIEGKRVRIAIPLPASVALADPYFYPLTNGVIDYAAPQTFSRAGDSLIMETGAKDETPRVIEGLLKISEGNGLEIRAAAGGPIAAGPPLSAKPSGAQGFTTIATALCGALLGGLLLNIMPCVFPILSLKALSLTRGSTGEREARREALAYAAGVILVCVALGILLLALRAGGAALGWAFQLQDPRMILLLLLLVCAIAFNLAGLFELPMLGGGTVLASGSGTTGAFWTGALAAFIATPCTGPFMAGALGAALVLPPAAALGVFAGLGIGLALPFLLLGFIPALRRSLPRPGAWMQTLRYVLSLPMFVTALGLAWILGRQAGVDAMTLGIGAAILLVAALWWAGRRQAAGKTRAMWPVLPAAAAALAVVMLLPSVGVAAKIAAAGAEAFSEARLTTLRQQGRPIFLYFTADWCLTCKVNEKVAIERAEVVTAFRKHDVAVMVGDWTRGDAAIGRFIAAQGRSGVPLYLFYPKGGGAPQILPQILTPSLLTVLGA